MTKKQRFFFQKRIHFFYLKKFHGALLGAAYNDLSCAWWGKGDALNALHDS